MTIKEIMENVEPWLKSCNFCKKPIKFGQKTVGSFEKKIAYHEQCYEYIVLNFGKEHHRQEFFKMKEEQ